MADVLIHPRTHSLIKTYLRRPAHGLLLAGPKGVGLSTIAEMVAHHIDPRVYIQCIQPDEKGTITIETIRGLYALTRSTRESALAVIIDDADAMGREAQNALLKLLEEPIEHVYFILTSHVPQQLLATITSRVQHIDVLPLPRGEVDGLIPVDTPAAVRSQLLFLAGTLPAELVRLCSDEGYFARSAKSMKDARAFLEGNTYTKLLLTKEYSGDRQQAIALLESIEGLLKFMLFAQADPKLAVRLSEVEQVSERLDQNAHVRTQLSYLVTRLSLSATM